MVRWIDGLKRSAPKQTPGTSSSLRQNSQQTPHPRASLANKFYLPQRRLQSENGGESSLHGSLYKHCPVALGSLCTSAHLFEMPLDTQTKGKRAYQPTPGTLQTSQACTVGCRLPGTHTSDSTTEARLLGNTHRSSAIRAPGGNSGRRGLFHVAIYTRSTTACPCPPSP